MASHQTHAAMTAWCRSVVLLGAISLSSLAIAGPALTPHSAEYKVKISVLGGTLKTELRATPAGFIATHVIRPTGMSRIVSHGTISASSEFSSTPYGVRPIEYSFRDTLSRDKMNASIRFNWDTGEARGMVNGEDVVSVMDALAHDRISIQYALMHDLLTDGPGSEYTMFEVDRLRTVNVRNVGSRTVRVPAGEFDVVGIQHQAEGSKRQTTLWCAKKLDYLPVVIEQHRKGKLRVRATLRRYTPSPDLPPVTSGR